MSWAGGILSPCSIRKEGSYMKLFIELLFWLIGALVLYGVAVYVTMKVTGCKCETAARKVRCFISGQPENPISYNPNLVDEIHSIIRGVVGESRYNARMRLENRLPLVVFLTQGSLPTIQVAMDCVEDNEKSRLEALIVDAVKNQLHVKGLCTEVIV